jgi:ribosome-binding factor A
MARGHHRSARPPAGFPRSFRVNEVLRQVLAEELERMADADERLRLVTVTSVDCQSDLRRAVVYLGHLEDDTAEALAERRPQLQAQVGRQVRLKRTPRLEFAADPALIAGAKVEAILRRLHGGGKGPGGD